MPWPCTAAVIYEDELTRGGLRAALEEAGLEVLFDSRRPDDRSAGAAPDLILTDVVFQNTVRVQVIGELLGA